MFFHYLFNGYLDPETFSIILSYLRSGILFADDTPFLLKRLTVEADFFQISDLTRTVRAKLDSKEKLYDCLEIFREALQEYITQGWELVALFEQENKMSTCISTKKLAYWTVLVSRDHCTCSACGYDAGPHPSSEHILTSKSFALIRKRK
jgi:hypothetical protein